MSKIQVSTKIKIPRGKIIEFKEAAADYINQVKEKDRELFKLTGSLVVMGLSVKSEKHTKIRKLS
jgi:hypothetical protein